MGFFDKKYCDICGEKIGLLGNRKLEDGNLCKNCAKKLSPWFDERRHSTVDQIKKQLAYREDNRSKANAFNITRSFGKGSTKLYVDDNARKFTVNRGTDFGSDNPDILDFTQALGCDLNIEERRHEKKRTVDGKSVSYNPPRFEYSYEFKVTIRVDHQYFDDMKFDLRGSSVNTGERCMTGMNTGSWNVSTPFSSFADNGVNEYSELVQLGNEIKAMIDSWRGVNSQPFGGAAQPFGGAFNSAPMNMGYGAAGAAGAAFGAAQGMNSFGGAQAETIRFGSKNPVPYTENYNGYPVQLYIRCLGQAAVSVFNPSVLQSRGGMAAVTNILADEINMAVGEALYQYSAQGVPFAHLPAKSAELSAQVKARLENNWMTAYGLALQSIMVSSFTLDQESQEMYKKLQQQRMAQGFYQQNQQPQQYQQQYQQPQQYQQQYQQPVQPQSAGWVCPYCGAQNAGKFCMSCGAKKGE